MVKESFTDEELLEIGRLTVLAERLRDYCTYEWTDEALIQAYRAFCQKYKRTERNGVGRKKADNQVKDQVRLLLNV